MIKPTQQEHFADRISLEQIDRDIFTGFCHAGAPLRAYGGQIAAQALMAAGRTVDASDRKVHSLHGYFLRPGGTKDSITYLVDRPRDGRSFSTRFVRAVQHGETIFMMSASFATIDPGPDHQFEMPSAPPPTAFTDVYLPSESHLDDGEVDHLNAGIISLRIVGSDEPVPIKQGRYEQLVWVRIREEVPDDWLTQACAMTYLSDLTLADTTLAPHLGMFREHDLMVASIDHAMWFHSPTRADDWLLFALDTPAARGGHGLARGLFFDPTGVLVTSVVQESLTRFPRQFD